MMKKFAIPFLLAAIFIAMLSAPALAEPQSAPAPMPAGTASPRDWDKLAPEGDLLDTAVKAQAAILVDANTGNVLFEKNADQRMYPASTTKLMTCLLALESGKSMSSIVTVGTLPKIPSDATNINLKDGEQMKLEDLLYGLMLESACDAANAIAMYLCDGDVEAFVQKMNDRAKELGMTNTHFVNTHGLHENDHYTTARDMAKLAMAAQKTGNLFANIVNSDTYKMFPTNKHTEERTWENTNQLVSKKKSNAYGYEYATGIKTGHTNEAAWTLVSSAKKGNVSLIAVVLHDAASEQRWPDSITMFEYGFNYYDTIDLVELLGRAPVTTTVKNAAASDEKNGELELSQLPKTKNKFITDRKDVIEQLRNDPTQFTQTITITKDTAPVKKDDVVGTASYSYNGETVLECDLLASRDIAEMPTQAPSASSQGAQTKSPGASQAGSASGSPGGTEAPQAKSGGSALIWVGVAILALLLALIVVRVVNMSSRNKKYRQYNFRQGNNTRLRR